MNSPLATFDAPYRDMKDLQVDFAAQQPEHDAKRVLQLGG